MKSPLRRRDPLDSSPRAKLISYILLIGWAIVVIFPLYWLVVQSFKLGNELATDPPVYIPSEITFQNYEQVLSQAVLPELLQLLRRHVGLRSHA